MAGIAPEVHGVFAIASGSVADEDGKVWYPVEFLGGVEAMLFFWRYLF